jgi:serine/threonine protein kinase
MKKFGNMQGAVMDRPWEFPGLSLSQFQKVRTIGVGSFSHVDLCYHVPSETYCVVKVMSKQRLIDLNQVEHIQHEIRIIRMVQHPNIVTFYGAFQDECNLYMMMEFIPGGEVFSHLRTLERFDLDVVRFYSAEILVVFQALHERGIIYRDLKPENLLFSIDGHIKFVDFGFAKRITDRTYTLCGTPEYLAPEIIRGEGCSFSSDWWAFGILIYEMLVGETPFHSENENENHMFQLICQGEFSFPIGTDDLTQDLINGLLTVDATRRLGCAAAGAEEIMQHAWFGGIDWVKVLEHRYNAPLVPYVDDLADPINFAHYDGIDTSNIPLTSPDTPDMWVDFE